MRLGEDIGTKLSTFHSSRTIAVTYTPTVHSHIATVVHSYSGCHKGGREGAREGEGKVGEREGRRKEGRKGGGEEEKME